MERTILSEQTKAELIKSGKLNGVEVSDERLEGLEEYLKLNPSDSVILYLDN